MFHKRLFLRKNNNAQVLGLPMYLIIIMIVAVAVIAAVILMIPSANKAIDYQITSNSLIAEDPGAIGAGEFTFQNSYTIQISVTDKSTNNPISGATVTLVGAGTSGTGTTGGDGIVTGGITLNPNPKLEENENDDYITIEITADGYDKLTDINAIHVVRLT